MRRIVWQREFLARLHDTAQSELDFGFHHDENTVAKYAFHYRNGFLPDEVNRQDAKLMDDIFTYIVLINNADVNDRAQADGSPFDVEVWYDE